MKRKLAALFLLCLMLMLAPNLAAAEEPGDASQPAFTFQDAMQSMDLGALEDYKQKVDSELGKYISDKSLSQWFLDFVKGDWDFDAESTGQFLLKKFLGEIMANSSLLGKLILLSVLAALLINLQNSFSGGVARISYWACYLALAVLALASFRTVLQIGHQTIDTMSDFMLAMLPQMLVLTAGLGNVNASVMLFPILMSAATAFAAAIKNIVFPLIIMSAVLSIVNHLSDSLKVEKMSKFFTQMAQISLAFFLTLFVGILTLRATIQGKFPTSGRGTARISPARRGPPIPLPQRM